MNIKKIAITCSVVGTTILVLAGCGNGEVNDVPVTSSSSNESAIYKQPQKELTGRVIDATGDLTTVSQPKAEVKPEKETKAEVKKADLTLRTLTVNDNKVDLKSEDWTFKVKNKVKTVSVMAEPNSKDASVTKGNGDHKLDIGKNKIQITVQNGKEEKTYTLVVVRKKAATKPSTESVPKKEPDQSSNSQKQEGGTPAHVHQYSAYVVAPTCETGGYTVHTCSCGDSYTDGYTQPTGHNFKSVTIMPKADQQGYTQYTCQNCGYSYVELY